jgi:N-acetylglucosamine-6-phosphate deacetylase
LQNTGALKPGQKADFVWLDDRITPLATWIAGRRVA